jgi:hypothetical protein
MELPRDDANQNSPDPSWRRLKICDKKKTPIQKEDTWSDIKVAAFYAERDFRPSSIHVQVIVPSWQTTMEVVNKTQPFAAFKALVYRLRLCVRLIG